MDKLNSPPPKKDNLNSRLRRSLTLLLLSCLVLVLVIFSVRVIDPSAISSINPRNSIETTAYKLSETTLNQITETPVPENIPIAASKLNLPAQPSLDLSQLIITATETISSQVQTFTNESNRLTLGQGTLIFSSYEGIHASIYAYHPQQLGITRLTEQAWDDINPACSPDGKKIAFASNRSGHWDLHILDLTTGQTRQVTNTPEFDASPSWSPDGRWLVYESYLNDPVEDIANLELLIIDASLENQEPIRLTNTSSAELSPTWSPNGRMIAYATLDKGAKDIWLANLDLMDNRFQNLTSNIAYPAQHPSWSPDGEFLLWSANVDGIQNLYQWKPDQPHLAPRYLSSGEWGVWDASGKVILTSIQTPNQTYITGYNLTDNNLWLPPTRLNGKLEGLCWINSSLPNPLPTFLQLSAKKTATPDWSVAIAPQSETSISRFNVVPLSNVNAPFALLNDLIDEAFQGLRNAVLYQIGWDFLSKLENAYVPLTSPLFPGMQDDWLYTGRAFAANSAPLYADWMTVVREDFSSSIYWRVYLRANNQDGSQGIPLRDLPWDFDQRLKGNPQHFEQGGDYMNHPPQGYWVDFTQLASSFGWERLPALSSWRIAPPATRFNEFIYRDNLDWLSAMLELYPMEALYTVTPPPPPTATPTKTPIPSRTPTPTITSTAGPTSTSSPPTPTATEVLQP